MNQVDMLVMDVIQSRSWKFLNAKILLSVLEQESNCEAFFLKTDPQYKQNMRAATTHLLKTEQQILKLVTLSNGKIAKFRFEKGQYHSRKWEKYPFEKRFYICSSWGLSQCMGFNLIQNVPQHQIASTILNFASDELAQVKFTAKTMEDYMSRAFHNIKIKDKSLPSLVFHAYSQYNGGSPITSNPDVLSRAQKVVSRI